MAVKQEQSYFQWIRRNSYWRERLMEVMQSSAENSASTEISVGRRLQELRMAQGLSIRALAGISGLNFNTLRLIESGKTSPNINTLQQIATALQVPITIFFETPCVCKDVVFQKPGQRSRTTLPIGELEDLGGGLALGEATPLLMTVKPHSNSGLEAIVHTGQEFIYCLEGNIVYCVGQDEYHLEPRDSLIFQASIPHRWENRGNHVSHCILVISPSDHGDRSVSQHLKGCCEKN